MLFVSIVMATMTGCYNSGSHEKELLDRIESLWIMSDSSLADAEKQTALLEDEMPNASEMINMKYNLLCIRLRDKHDVIPASDDSIKKVVDYFEKHGDISDKTRAYHYMSSVYRDLHDSPRAITSDLKALELMETDSKNDTLLLMHIYSNLSALYRRQLNMEKSIHMALRYYYLLPDDPWAMMDVASAYHKANDSTNALVYYEKAYNHMMEDTKKTTHLSNYMELISRFTEYGVDDKAQNLYNRLGNIPESVRPSNYDIALGLFHKKHNNLDSALYYFEHRYENARNWVGKCDAASQIMECYNTKGDYPKASEYAVKFRQANDSVIAQRQFDLTRNAQAEYKYNRNRDEEAQIKLDALNMQRWLLIVVILFMMVVAFGYVYYIHKRKKLEERILKSHSRISLLRKEVEEKESSVRHIKEELDQSCELLNAKRIELTEVITTMAEKQQEMIEMKEHLSRSELAMAELKSKLVETDSQIAKLQYELAGKSTMNKELIKELLSKEITELNTDILEIFDKSTSNRVQLTEVQWAAVFSNIDRKNPELKSILAERVPRLNLALMRTAYLMMAGLTNQQIESIMGVSRQTQWERAKKLEKYIGDILPYRKFQ